MEERIFSPPPGYELLMKDERSRMESSKSKLGTESKAKGGEKDQIVKDFY